MLIDPLAKFCVMPGLVTVRLPPVTPITPEFVIPPVPASAPKPVSTLLFERPDPPPIDPPLIDTVPLLDTAPLTLITEAAGTEIDDPKILVLSITSPLAVRVKLPPR